MLNCDCIVFRLYAKLLSTHGPNLAYCAIFLNKLVNLLNCARVGRMGMRCGRVFQ